MASATSSRLPRITQEGKSLVIHPLSGSHKSTLIFTHGLGDTAEGWKAQAASWATSLPTWKFVLPTAPTQPVSINGGMPMPSWYNITGLDEKTSEQAEGIETSKDTINSLVHNEINKCGIPASRIILGGFSQGGALSLFTGLQWTGTSESLGGILVLSGYLAAASRITLSDQGKKTPVYQFHGSSDPLISLANAENGKSAVKEMGHLSSYFFKNYKNLVHSTSKEEMEDVLSVLRDFDVFKPEKEPKNVECMTVRELKEALIERGVSDLRGFLDKESMIEALKELGNNRSV